MREGRESLLTEVHHPDVSAEADGVVGVTGVVPTAGTELLPLLLLEQLLLLPGLERDGGPGPGPVTRHVRHPVLGDHQQVGRAYTTHVRSGPWKCILTQMF